MFKWTRLAIGISLLFFSTSYAQDRVIDSLKLVLKNPKLHDTTKIAAVGTVMDNSYTENDPKYYYLNDIIGDLARKNLKKENNKVLRETYTSWLATYYNVRAIDYGHKKEAVKGLAAIDKSIALYKSINAYDDANYQVIIKGSFYSLINENEKAIYCIFTALRYFEKDKVKYTGELAYATSILANIYTALGNFPKAIEYNKKVIEYHDSNKTHVDYQKDYLKCVAYANISNDYLALKQFRDAIAYGEKALVLAKKVGDPTSTSLILSKLGMAKMSLHQYAEAETLLQQALTLTTDERAIGAADLILGKMYLVKKQQQQAEFYANKALAAGIKIKDLDLQQQSYQILYKTYEESKDFEKALAVFKLNDKLLDSIRSNTSKKVLAQQQLKYDFEKKELNYKLAGEKKNAAKNIGLIILSSVLLLIVLGGYFYYRTNRQKQAISVLEKNQIKQRLLISQMNPHFIFNSIQNIRSLINTKQDAAAVKYLDSFSKLTRQILENSTENYISLDEEIEMIENYLSIQQLLYNNKFDYDIAVDEAIDTESHFLPPMLTQPFIENAIKHGLSNVEENGLISVRFYQKEKKLFFEVLDNGKGFGHDTQNGHKSLAMKITQERLSHHAKKGNFEVQTGNITDEAGNVKGAKVHFEIPYIYEN